MEIEKLFYVSNHISYIFLFLHISSQMKSKYRSKWGTPYGPCTKHVIDSAAILISPSTKRYCSSYVTCLWKISDSLTQTRLISICGIPYARSPTFKTYPKILFISSFFSPRFTELIPFTQIHGKGGLLFHSLGAINNPKTGFRLN